MNDREQNLKPFLCIPLCLRAIGKGTNSHTNEAGAAACRGRLRALAEMPTAAYPRSTQLCNAFEDNYWKILCRAHLSLLLRTPPGKVYPSIRTQTATRQLLVTTRAAHTENGECYEREYPCLKQMAICVFRPGVLLLVTELGILSQNEKHVHQVPGL